MQYQIPQRRLTNSDIYDFISANYDKLCYSGSPYKINVYYRHNNFIATSLTLEDKYNNILMKFNTSDQYLGDGFLIQDIFELRMKLDGYQVIKIM